MNVSDSTAFKSVTYNEGDQTLDVVYNDGTRRRYYDVTHAVAKQFMDKTPSAGRYYNKNIRGQYKTRKLPK
jgi:hypothetical protein